MCDVQTDILTEDIQTQCTDILIADIQTHVQTDIIIADIRTHVIYIQKSIMADIQT